MDRFVRGTTSIQPFLGDKAGIASYFMAKPELHAEILKRVLANNNALTLGMYFRLLQGSALQQLAKILLNLEPMCSLNVDGFVRCLRDAQLQEDTEDNIFFAFLPYCKPAHSAETNQRLTADDLEWVFTILTRAPTHATDIVRGLCRRSIMGISTADRAFFDCVLAHLKISRGDLETILTIDTRPLAKQFPRASLLIMSLIAVHI